MHVEWMGGDVVRFPGGGHKVNMLRPVIEQWKGEEGLVVMFVDRSGQAMRQHCSRANCCTRVCLCSYDVVFTMGAEAILKRFRDFDCRLVFSAESFCWPDVSLAVTPQML